ncbi:MAG: glycoside hydrolase, partial [Candidatus Acidiferrales bacterium]
IYSTSIVTVRSIDGARTWTSIRGAPGGDDYQNVWINPRDPKIVLIVADQGAIITVNGGETWSSWYNQPTAQLYHVSTSNDFPYKVCGGQQESGSVCTLSRGNDGEITYRDWHPVGAIEYGYVTPDPLNPDIIYGAGRTEVSKYNWRTGQVQNVTPFPLRDPKYRTDRSQPIMFSPVDPHILYTTANFLFKSTDGGNNWQTISPDLAREHPGIPPSVGNMAAKDPKADKQRGVIYALAPSFRTENILWVGTDDGYIWTTRDGGKNWANITPPDLTPWSKVTQLSASHFDDVSAYASVSRFRIDDLKPYIYRTHDSGKTWQLITTGLPDNAPVDTVREDPVRKGLLFAGTETSVWVSFDDGDRWQSLQLNLPHTSMRDLWIHEDDLIVATHGRSFWILDDISPLRQLSESLTHANASLFKPAPAFRVRRSTYTDTPMPPDEPAGQNPPDGAIIDYFLAQPAAGPVTLEILDAQGKLVRKFSSTDKPDQTQEEIAKQLIPLYWIRPQKILSAEAGMHRWLWDLHYPAPVSLRHEYPISAVPHDTPRHPLGPRALPGTYSVKLTADGKTFAAPLTVRMDPRVKTPPEGLRAQFQMQTSLANMMTHSSEAVVQARSLHEQIEKLSSSASGSTKETIESLDKKISDLLGAAPAPAAQKPAGLAPEPTLTHVAGDIAPLYAEVDRADVAPTPAQAQALAAIERDFGAAIKRWDALKATDIPALNRQLKSASLPELSADSHLTPVEEPGSDEE